MSARDGRVETGMNDGGGGEGSGKDDKAQSRKRKRWGWVEKYKVRVLVAGPKCRQQGIVSVPIQYMSCGNNTKIIYFSQ